MLIYVNVYLNMVKSQIKQKPTNCLVPLSLIRTEILIETVIFIKYID